MYKKPTAVPANQDELPTGIHRQYDLPDPSLDLLWDSIILDPAIKDRLLNQAVVNFRVRKEVDRSVLPMHGVMLLTGEPGTGKTSLAKALASRLAGYFPGGRLQLLEVEPHSLTSSAMGKTQRAVSELFSQSIAEAAATRPTIVLLDEVETLAADRTKLSMDANPIDIHRATDAVLVQLDKLADTHSDLLFIATSNFPQAVDGAFTSRADLVLQVPLPDAAACASILRSCLDGLGRTYPSVGRLASASSFGRIANECVGLDGRAIRKMVANALAVRKEVAVDPNKLTAEDLMAAAQSARANRLAAGGRK